MSIKDTKNIDILRLINEISILLVISPSFHGGHRELIPFPNARVLHLNRQLLVLLRPPKDPFALTLQESDRRLAIHAKINHVHKHWFFPIDSQVIEVLVHWD